MTNIQDILDKIGKSDIADPKKLQLKVINLDRRKPIYVFNRDGILIEEYDSLKAVKKVYGDVRSTMNKKLFLNDKFFSYEKSFEPKKPRFSLHLRIPVELYKDGIFVAKFDSYTQCAKFIGCNRSLIRQNLSGQLKKIKNLYTVKLSQKI